MCKAGLTAWTGLLTGSRRGLDGPSRGGGRGLRARQAGVPFAWVTGDSVYGADHAIRRWAERHRCGYVLAVTSKQYLGQRPVTRWIKRLPRKAWQRLSAGDGAKGPRLYD